MKRPVVSVTDHAVVRYLERVEGVDIAATRRQIARAVRLAEDYPGCTGVIKNGFVYKLNPSGDTVVTVHRNGRK